MAIYIPIRMENQNEELVEYSYEAGPEQGRVALIRETGEVREIQGTSGPKGAEYLARVMFKLKKHWKRGEYPEKTSWSS